MRSLFKKKSNKQEWKAYCNGTLLPISEVPDDVFSQKMMGEGVAIRASADMIVAPMDGEVSLITPTHHAIALQTKDDMQILIHIGLDSTLHSLDRFSLKVEVSDKVKAGDPLIQIMDFKNDEELYIPMVIVENPQERSFTYHHDQSQVEATRDVIISYDD